MRSINTGTAALTLMLTTAAGLGFMMFGVWLSLLLEQFSLQILSVATSGLLVVTSLFGLVVGHWVRKYDVRRVIFLGGLFCSSSLLLFPHIGDSLLMLATVYGLFALGFASSSVMVGQTLITRWFRDQNSRSARLAIVTTGLSIGGIIVAPLATLAIKTFGLTTAMPAIGVIYLASNLISVLMLKPRLTRPRFSQSQPQQRMTRSERRLVIFMSTGMFLFMGANVGGMQHLYYLCETLFTDFPELPVWGMIAMSSSSLVARFIGSWFMRKTNISTYASTVLLMQMITMLLLPHASTPAMFLLFSMMFGTTISNVIMVQSLMASAVIRTERYGILFPKMSAITGFGLASGPLLAGLIAGSWGYVAAYTLLGGFSLAALLTLIVVMRHYLPKGGGKNLSETA